MGPWILRSWLYSRLHLMLFHVPFRSVLFHVPLSTWIQLHGEKTYLHSFCCVSPHFKSFLFSVHWLFSQQWPSHLFSKRLISSSLCSCWIWSPNQGKNESKKGVNRILWVIMRQAGRPSLGLILIMAFWHWPCTLEHDNSDRKLFLWSFYMMLL